MLRTLVPLPALTLAVTLSVVPGNARAASRALARTPAGYGWTLTGIVSDARTGLPVAGATVDELDPGSCWSYEGTTDATGRYAIENFSVLVPGQFCMIRVEAYGYAPWSTEVATRDTLDTLDIQLTPVQVGMISGVVLDSATHLPLIYATVTATYLGSDSLQALLSPAQIWTDSAGAYSLVVPVGRLAVSASLGSYETRWVGNAPDSAHASTVLITERGQLVRLDFLLPPTPPPVYDTLSGVVYSTDNGGDPIAGAEVDLWGAGGATQQTTTDNNGGYALVVIDQTDWFVSARSGTAYPVQFWNGKYSVLDANLVVMNGSRSGIDFHLAPAHTPVTTIMGSTIVCDTSGGVPAGPSWVVAYSLADSTPFAVRTVETNPDGSFTLALDRTVLAGSSSFLLEVVPTDPALAPGWFSGDGQCVTDWRDATVLAAVDSIPRRVCAIGIPAITADSGVAHITGTVTVGVSTPALAALGGAVVYVADAHGVLRGAAVASASGRFDIGGLRGGAYHLRADRAGFRPYADVPVTIRDTTRGTGTRVRMVRDGFSGVSDAPWQPSGSALAPNYPNPFSTTSTIAFLLDRAAPVVLDLFSPLGTLRLHRACGTLSPGPHALTLDAAALAPGTYLARLRTPYWSATREVVVVY